MSPRRAPAGDQVRAAYEGCWQPLLSWLDTVPDELDERPSVLPGWTVSDLLAHLTLVADSVAALQPSTDPPMPLPEYLATYPEGAEAIDKRTRLAAGGPGRRRGQVLSVLAERRAAATRVLDGLVSNGSSHRRVVRARRGPILLSDFLLTRVVELVVHADDLGRSLSAGYGADLGREATGMAVRTLLGVLEARWPGSAVEVRVPPFGAVQCGAGPRHARGTPPNVVELSPTVWLRLAAGRVAWSDAHSQEGFSASGARADLSGWLPLL